MRMKNIFRSTVLSINICIKNYDKGTKEVVKVMYVGEQEINARRMVCEDHKRFFVETSKLNSGKLYTALLKF